MSYTSGRTVKTSRTVKPSTPASATRDARRLVTRHLPQLTGVTIDSRLDYDFTTNTCLVRTVITYPATADASDLACAVESLPGLVRSTWDTVAITIIRKG
jgi:hypothetical protein